MTQGQIKETTCSTTVNEQKFMDFINETCIRFEINTQPGNGERFKGWRKAL